VAQSELAASNPQVSILQQELTDAQAQLVIMQQQLNDVQTQLNHVQAQLVDVQGQLYALQEDYDQLAETCDVVKREDLELKQQLAVALQEAREKGQHARQASAALQQLQKLQHDLQDFLHSKLGESWRRQLKNLISRDQHKNKLAQQLKQLQAYVRELREAGHHTMLKVGLKHHGYSCCSCCCSCKSHAHAAPRSFIFQSIADVLSKCAYFLISFVPFCTYR
jgi:chromosome segregation ATPase